MPSLDVPSANRTRVSRFGEPGHHFSARGSRPLPSLAVDEHAALKPGEGAKEWPACHLALGDEGQRRHGAQDRDVEPRDMVDRDEAALIGDRLAADPQLNAEQPGHGAMIQVGKSPRRLLGGPDQHLLNRQAGQGHQHEPQKNDEGAQSAHVARSLRIKTASSRPPPVFS
jgi:hypothetical protein